MTPRTPDRKPAGPGVSGDPFRDEAGDAVDVQRIHMNIVGREKEEPEEGFEPTPWWVWTASVLLLFVMGFYLGRYGGSFSSVAHEVENPALAGAAPLKREVRGDEVYAGVCQACHQATGLGVPGQYPPLAGSEWLVQDAATPIRIVLFGLEGEVSVKGSRFDNKMPAFQDKLSSDEIAAVLSHVRASWGNRAPAVTPAEVDTLRKTTGTRGPWTAPGLTVLRRKSPS
jgi:mono/diheme cytochrome c family protein